MIYYDIWDILNTPHMASTKQKDACKTGLYTITWIYLICNPLNFFQRFSLVSLTRTGSFSSISVHLKATRAVFASWWLKSFLWRARQEAGSSIMPGNHKYRQVQVLLSCSGKEKFFFVGWCIRTKKGRGNNPPKCHPMISNAFPSV